MKEVLLVWSLSFALIVATFVAWNSQAKLVATVTFLYLPYFFMRRRNEDFADYGVTFSRWRADLRNVAKLCLIVGPLFFLAFWGFSQVLPLLPSALAHRLTPFPTTHFAFHPRLPPQYGRWIVDQLFVVALPEEFFYRGYILGRLRQQWPGGTERLGIRWGRAFWVTAVLFALGHLAIFQVWRLAVFFPALLFGWLRERTGTVMGAALFHALCNLFELFLEASFAPIWIPR